MSDSSAKQAARYPAPSIATSIAERYARQLKGYLRYRLRRREEVEDCAQKVYLKLLRMDPKKLLEKPLAYVFTVARNVLRDHQTEAKQEAELFSPAEEAPDTWYENASGELRNSLEEDLSVRQQLEKALSAIPPMQAAVLILHARDGLSNEEVAVKLNLSVHTVRKYLDKGRARIRMELWDP